MFLSCKDNVVEQGVMVDLQGNKPIIIRLGLDSDAISGILKDLYGPAGYTIDHGAYP